MKQDKNDYLRQKNYYNYVFVHIIPLTAFFVIYFSVNLVKTP